MDPSQAHKTSIHLARTHDGRLFFAPTPLKLIQFDNRLPEAELSIINREWPSNERVKHLNLRPIGTVQNNTTSSGTDEPSSVSDCIVTMSTLNKMMDEQEKKIINGLVEVQKDFLMKQADQNQQMFDRMLAGMEKFFGTLPVTTKIPEIKHIEIKESPVITEICNQKSVQTDSEVLTPLKTGCEAREKPSIKSDIILKQQLFIPKTRKSVDSSKKIDVTDDEQFVETLMKNLPDLHEAFQQTDYESNQLTSKEFENQQLDTVSDEKQKNSESAVESVKSSLEDGEIHDERMEAEKWEQHANRVKHCFAERVSNPIDICLSRDNKFVKETNMTEALIKKLIDEQFQNTLQNNYKNDTVNCLKEEIQIELINSDANVNRVYKLDSDYKFEMFNDFLMSELRTKRLDYVLDLDKKTDVTESKLLNDKNHVRDIIINHIDLAYYSKIVDIKEPLDILNKLREIKRVETRTTSTSARRDLYTFKFKPQRWNVSEFCDKFDDKIRILESIPGVDKLNDKEKRDVFFQAIVESYPNVNIVDSVCRETKGKELSYNQLKNYILQEESLQSKKEPPRAALFSKGVKQIFYRGRGKRGGSTRTLRTNEKARCFQCGLTGHVSRDCPNPDLLFCYKCRKLGKHIASECRAKRPSSDDFSSTGSKRHRSEGTESDQKIERPNKDFGNTLRNRGFGGKIFHRGGGRNRTGRGGRGIGRLNQNAGTSFMTAAEEYKGLDAELYYVREGIINTYAMNFVVPVAVNIDDLEFTWRSLAGQPLPYSMKLDYDMSGVPGYGSGRMALLPPKVNVSSRGFVPVTQQVFAIRLPCSGLASAEIKLSLKLNVTAPPESKYNDTNLVFKRNKICMKGIRTESKNDSVKLEAGPLTNGNGIFYVAATCACALILVVVSVASAIYIRNSKARSQHPRKSLTCCSYSAAGTGGLAGSSVLVKVDNRPGSANSGSYATIADLEPLYARPCGSRASYYAASHVTHLSQSTDPCEKARAQAVPRSALHCRSIVQEGTFGRVYRGTLSQAGREQEVIIKTVTEVASAYQASLLVVEGSQLAGLVHGNVATLGAACLEGTCPMLAYACSLSELNLKTYLTNGEHHPVTRDLVNIAVQVARAGAFLHGRGILHRDIAARNCLVDTSTLRTRLADAALSRDLFPQDYHCLGDNENRAIGWMALETLQHGQYSTATDTWSFGVFLWELATMGQQPYLEVDPFELTVFLRDGYRLSQPRPCPDELFAVMAVCWLGPARDRPTMPQLLAYLQEFYDALGGFI